MANENNIDLFIGGNSTTEPNVLTIGTKRMVSLENGNEVTLSHYDRGAAHKPVKIIISMESGTLFQIFNGSKAKKDSVSKNEMDNVEEFILEHKETVSLVIKGERLEPMIFIITAMWNDDTNIKYPPKMEVKVKPS